MPYKIPQKQVCTAYLQNEALLYHEQTEPVLHLLEDPAIKPIKTYFYQRYIWPLLCHQTPYFLCETEKSISRMGG